MNVKLLRKVQKHILEEPKRLDMRQWTSRNVGQCLNYRNPPECGTVACIGGWSCLLAGLPYSGPYASAEVLQLNGLQSSLLFYVRHWPEKFRRKYKGQRYPKQLLVNAKVTSERIDHFIKTKGRE